LSTPPRSCATREGRRDSEQNARQDADGSQKGEHGDVHGEDDPVRLPAVRDRRIERANAEDRDRQPQRAADDTEQHAFDQQLPDDAPARGAHRNADRDLARPRGRSREEEVCDVRARDEQHEADRAHHREKHGANRPAVEALVERLEIRAAYLLIVLRVLADQPSPDGIHLRLRLAAADTGPHAAEDVEPRDPALLLLGRDEHRPDIVVLRELHAFWHHADDDRRLAVDTRELADDVRITTVAILPDAVADDDGEIRPAPLVRGPKSRPSSAAQHREGVGRQVGAPRLLGQAAVVGDVHVLAGPGAQATERLRLLAPLLQFEVGQADPSGPEIPPALRQP
jgi:hypothetical protein